MRAQDVSALCDYLYWVRDQVLSAADGVDPEEFRAPEAVTTRGLRATLVHELDVEWSWRERLRTGAFPDEPDLDPERYPTVATLVEHWRRDEAEMRAWLAGIGNADLEASPPLGVGELPLWTYALHIVTHGLQQLSDAATLLSQAGSSPGGLEFLDYALSERSQ